MGSELDSPTVELSVVIVSYNTREMTLDCLRATQADISGITSEIWVVDNASKDGSADAIRAAFPEVQVIENDINAGFGAANNLAMKSAVGRFFLLINSDAFVAPGAIAAMLSCAKSHEDAAVIGPRLLNRDGTLQVSCYRFPSPFRAWLENLWVSTILSTHPTLGDYRSWPHDSERIVDSVTGACMLVRREAFEATGGFDERYFMYQEETDWQKSLRELGWNIRFTPTAVVTHYGGASGSDESARIDANFFNSLDFYERKHHGLFGVLGVRLAMMVGCSLRAVAWSAVMIAVRGKRNHAAVKSRFHCKLLLRQATCWRTALRGS